MAESVDVPPMTPVAPPRKRRRPALSCEQCRRRKIKCDRTYPCGQCLQSKAAACTYSPGSVPKSGHVNGGAAQRPKDTAQVPIGESTIGQWATNNGVPIPNRTRVPPSTASSGNPPSDSTSPKVVTSSDGSQATWPSPNKTYEESLGNNKELLTRILEKLSEPRTKRDGPSCTVEREEFQFSLDQKDKTRGTVSKTRFFGQSHWMYSFGAFDRISCMKVNPENNTPGFSDDLKDTDVFHMLEECKALSRAAKALPHNRYLLNPNFRESVPPRDICDKLLEAYFRTAESIYRVLHIPSFQREYNQYWANPSVASSPFILKMLLAMSIGASFYQEPDSEHWRGQALQWLFAAQAWISTPFEKKRLHISGLQIHCLVLLSRLENAVASDLVWSSAGSLVRTAFQMGFHRDPKYLPRMSPLHSELRRRLWATVLELNLQSSLDSGMPALITRDDYDTEPPANIDDTDIDENITVAPDSKPKHVFTQTSLQIRLLNSIIQRFEVVNHSNNIRREPSYEEVLRLSSEITTILKENSAFVKSTNRSLSPPKISQMSHNLFDLAVRRFLLTLHRPFAARAARDPRYYFSRKICLDTSITFFSYPSACPSELPLPEGTQDDYTRMSIIRGGFCKGLLIHGAMVIFAEILAQLEEESSFTDQSRAAREPLKQILRNCVTLLADRIAISENNVKGHLFFSVILAQIEALETDGNAEQMVMEAGRLSVIQTLDLLRKRITHPVSAKDYDQHVENGTSPDGIGFDDTSYLDPSMDFTMDDWNMDFNLPDSWLLSGWENNQPWGLQI